MYEEFSVVYDSVMSDIPYGMWFERLHRELERRGKAGGYLCELGCGTGEMTGRFCDAGYEVTGIDLSPDMLARAMEKKEEDQQILYLNQDMRDFSLHKPADVTRSIIFFRTRICWRRSGVCMKISMMTGYLCLI